jgi:hypothetical protein
MSDQARYEINFWGIQVSGQGLVGIMLQSQWWGCSWSCTISNETDKFQGTSAARHSEMTVRGGTHVESFSKLTAAGKWVYADSGFGW